MDLITKNPGLQHISEKIFMNLDSKCLTTCQEVNPYWFEMIKNPKFWLKKCTSITSSVKITLKSQIEWTKAIQALKNKREKSTLTSYLMKMHDMAEFFEFSPLQIAARKGHKAILKTLAPLMTDTLNDADPDGWTPIHLPSNLKRPEIIKILAPLTVHPNSPDKDGWTIIQKAACMQFEKGNAEIVKLLAPLTENPNSPNHKGWTPIQMAVRRYSAPIGCDQTDELYKIISILAPLSVDPNAQDPDGWTPIQRAVKVGKSEIIKLLVSLKLTINPNSPDPQGWTPIQYAAYRISSNIFNQKTHEYYEILKILIPLSDNPNAPDPRGWTPIQRATKNGKLEIIKLLAPTLRNNLDSTDPEGWTPIQRATKDCNSEIIKVLAPLTKNLNAPDPEGLTPIERSLKRKREIDDILTSLVDNEHNDKEVAKRSKICKFFNRFRY